MSFYPRHEDMVMEDHSDSSSSSSSSHTMMAMVFQTDRATPLFSDAWTPSTSGSYAGTCIFLVVLAIIARCLVALKTVQESRWRDREARRRYVAVNGKLPLAERITNSPDAKQMTLSENGVEQSVVVVERSGSQGLPRPWRFSVDPVRAVMDVLIVGVGYLLMLAVMTMNVGYFLSVLAGVFIGSLAVGRYAPEIGH